MRGREIRGSDRTEYKALVASFAPRPIHNAKQLVETMARIDQLVAKSRRTAAEDDYLALLSDMVDDWETKHSIFGTDSIVSEVLAGKRGLQRRHIEQLAPFFHVSPAAFFPPTEPVRRRKVAASG